MLRPDYPAFARRARYPGTMFLEVFVSAHGDVSCARQTELPFGLGEAAVAAARRWTFRPYLRDGRPASFRGTVEIRFSVPTRAPVSSLP